MFRQHQNILRLKKSFKIYGLQVQNNVRNTLTYNINTFCFDSSTNYLIIYNCDRNNPHALLNNNIKILQLHWESLEAITKKLIKYGILPIQTISATQRPLQASINEMAQSKLQNSNQNNARLLG